MSGKIISALIAAVGLIAGSSGLAAKDYSTSSKAYTDAQNAARVQKHWCDAHPSICRQYAISHIPSMQQHRSQKH
jgi:hypothetical protein